MDSLALLSLLSAGGGAALLYRGHGRMPFLLTGLALLVVPTMQVVAIPLGALLIVTEQRNALDQLPRLLMLIPAALGVVSLAVIQRAGMAGALRSAARGGLSLAALLAVLPALLA